MYISSLYYLFLGLYWHFGSFHILLYRTVSYSERYIESLLPPHCIPHSLWLWQPLATSHISWCPSRDRESSDQWLYYIKSWFNHFPPGIIVIIYSMSCLCLTAFEIIWVTIQVTSVDFVFPGATSMVWDNS